MLSLWIAPIFVFVALVKAEQAPNETAPIKNILHCPQSEYCTEIGGQCFREKHAPLGAKLIKEGGKKVRCNGKRRCLCYKLKEVETSSPAPGGDCSLPATEHVGNDLVLPPIQSNSSEECQQICAGFPGCKHFTYFSIEDVGCVESMRGNCYLKDEPNETHNSCAVSGSLACLPVERLNRGASCQAYETGPYGGAGGDFFTDGNWRVPRSGIISAIQFRSGWYMDSIQMKYGNNWASKHGGNGGNPRYISLSGRKIIAVKGWYGWVINSLDFQTDDYTWTGTVGSSHGTFFKITTYGCHLDYISGGSGSLLDRINFHWICS